MYVIKKKNYYLLILLYLSVHITSILMFVIDFES